MSTQSPVEVHVIFDASKGRGRRSVRKTPSPRSRPPSPTRSVDALVLIVGLASIAFAGVCYYATWWKADPEIYLRLVTKTPVAVDVDLEQAAALILGIREPPGAKKKANPFPEAAATTAPDFPPANWSGRTTQIAIPATAYAWLTTSTVSYLLVAMAGGAMVLNGATRRRVGAVVAAASILGLLVGTYYVYSTYGTYRPTDLRYGMGIVVLLCVGVGSIVCRGGRGGRGGKIVRAASVGLIVAAIVTAAGLYVGGQCGAMRVEHFTPQFIAIAFAVHAAWGGVLLPLAKRM